MAELPLPPEAQLRERIRDLEAELARLRQSATGSGTSSERADRLNESEERFRVAFMTSPAGMSIVRGSDGRLLFVNAAFCRNSGYSEDEIIGRTFEELGIYADEEQRQKVFTRLIAQGYIENEEFRYRTRAGESRVGLLSSRPITLRGEVCQLGVMVDITETRRAEAERARLEDRLRQGQKMEAIGRLAGGVAHDFNNMLTAIMANVSLGMMYAKPDDAVFQPLLEIRDAASRAAQLTAQMLAFSRKQLLEPRPVNVSQNVEQMRAMLRRVIGEDISLVFDLAPQLPLVMADRSQLEQVILNLVVNARDAVDTHGSIAVTTYAAEVRDDGAERGRAGRFVVLSVKDDGRGIPSDVLPHVFEPFYSTKSERGTGLGLSTVDGIVTQHGGFIEVDTSPGGGATFRVFLPVAPDGVVETRPLQTKTAGGTRSGVIVLAEDDDAVREPTTQLLERLGFTVLAARSGADALERVRTHEGTIDMLLTDMVMPTMSGRELADAVRVLAPNIAVVYMSGYPQDVVDHGGVIDPGVVLLRKPFGADQLVEALARGSRGSARR